MHLGYIKYNGKNLDEVLVSIMKAPHTYTREDIAEINCHGGAVAVNEVLRAVLASGARLAEPGEFTKRAFINGRIDLSQAEAVLDIVRAKTARSLETAVKQLSGAITENIERIVQELKAVLVILEASIDFPEEDDVSLIQMDDIKEKIISIEKELDHLIISYDTGKIYRNGVLTAILGKPNVGKSSVFNAFLKFDRAIVTPIPGTTRDVIEEQVNIKGVPFILADTAGIAYTENIVEMEGVKKSRSYMDNSQLVLLIFDGSNPFDERDLEIAKNGSSKEHLTVINKVDLPQKLNIKELIGKTDINPDPVYISAIQGKGLKELEVKMTDRVIEGNTAADYTPIVTSARQYSLLKKASTELNNALRVLNRYVEPELIAFDVRSAMDILGEISGKITNKDILEDIFNNFCIGK